MWLHVQRRKNVMLVLVTKRVNFAQNVSGLRSVITGMSSETVIYRQ